MKGFFIILLAVMTTATAYSQTGTIRELTGEVEIRPAGTANFRPARAGNQVAQDTIISTGFRSTAIIVIGSNEILVRPLTRLSLAEISSAAGEENINVNLQTGRIRVEVRPPAGTRAITTVQSPSATASVRGTTFEMDTVHLSVHHGKVLFQGRDGLNVPVLSGGASSITSGGGSQSPIETAGAGLMPPEPAGLGEAGLTTAVFTPLTGEVSVNVGWN